MKNEIQNFYQRVFDIAAANPRSSPKMMEPQNASKRLRPPSLLISQCFGEPIDLTARLSIRINLPIRLLRMKLRKPIRKLGQLLRAELCDIGNDLFEFGHV